MFFLGLNEIRWRVDVREVNPSVDDFGIDKTSIEN